MEIKRKGSQAASKGPAEYFTGAVRVDPLLVPRSESVLVSTRLFLCVKFTNAMRYETPAAATCSARSISPIEAGFGRV
jgi:hypothetical protein